MQATSELVDSRFAVILDFWGGRVFGESLQFDEFLRAQLHLVFLDVDDSFKVDGFGFLLVRFHRLSCSFSAVRYLRAVKSSSVVRCP